MKTLITALKTTVLLFTLLQNYVNAATITVLDQSQEVDGGSTLYWADRSLAQTFTTGFDMKLDFIELRMDTFAPRRSYPTTVQIRSTINGAPAEEILGSVFFDSGFLPSFPERWATINYLDQNIFLEENTTYSIVLLNDDPSFADGATNEIRVAWDPMSYIDGALWANDGLGWEQLNAFGTTGDIGFRTYGVVPLPGSLLLFLTGLPMLLFKVRKT